MGIVRFALRFPSTFYFLAAVDQLALSHQPLLLIVTCPIASNGFNKFNGLASRKEASQEPFLARCDNAGSGRTAGRLSDDPPHGAALEPRTSHFRSLLNQRFVALIP